jgi:hypothetical protein
MGQCVELRHQEKGELECTLGPSPGCDDDRGKGEERQGCGEFIRACSCGKACFPSHFRHKLNVARLVAYIHLGSTSDQHNGNMQLSNPTSQLQTRDRPTRRQLKVTTPAPKLRPDPPKR